MIEYKDTFRHKSSQKLIFSQEATEISIYKNWECKQKKIKSSDLGTRDSRTREKLRKCPGVKGWESHIPNGSRRMENSQRNVHEEDVLGGSTALTTYSTILKKAFSELLQDMRSNQLFEKKKKQLKKVEATLWKTKKLYKKGHVIICNTWHKSEQC